VKVIVCKVCNRRLNHYADEFGVSYAHPLDVTANHEPEPAEAPADWRGKCDFCGNDDPVAVLPVDDFRLPMNSSHQSLGDWAACGMCAVLIESGRWQAMSRRAAAKYGSPADIVVLFSLEMLYVRLRAHTRGPLRPLGEEGERG
jgi:hypothetical protein